MRDILKSTVLLDNGYVEVLRLQGESSDLKHWRVSIRPNDESGLDSAAPEILEDKRQAILARWSTIPLPVPDPPPTPPTNDEIYDRAIQIQRVFKGYVLAINDGSIVPGSNMTGAQIKAAVKEKM